MPELVEKSTAMYFQPESIGTPQGARCGICWKFDESRAACIEVDGRISGSNGVCGLYVHGDPIANELKLLGMQPSQKVSQEEAGYTTEGPTHCGNCDEMLNRGIYRSSPCKRVQGTVDGRACCNFWERVK